MFDSCGPLYSATMLELASLWRLAEPNFRPTRITTATQPATCSRSIAIASGPLPSIASATVSICRASRALTLRPRARAAAAASLANLSSQQMRWVLDYTAQQTAGIAAWKRDLEHVEKSFVFAGMPARNGVTAALLVQAGWTGVDDIFSGSDNFLLAFAPQADPAVLIEKLGERYEVVRTNIKKWTVGSPIQAPLDGMEALLKKHKFRAEDVKKVIVRSASQEAVIVDNRTMPDLCLQHMIAVMLVDGTASFRSAHDEKRMHDPAILRERAKVELIADEGLDRLLPKRVAIVEVVLNNGTHLNERVDAVRGTADNPMSREEIVAKSRDLIAPVLGSATGDALIDKVLKLENVKSIRELRPLLQRA